MDWQTFLQGSFLFKILLHKYFVGINKISLGPGAKSRKLTLNFGHNALILAKCLIYIYSERCLFKIISTLSFCSLNSEISELIISADIRVILGWIESKYVPHILWYPWCILTVIKHLTVIVESSKRQDLPTFLFIKENCTLETYRRND